MGDRRAGNGSFSELSSNNLEVTDAVPGSVGMAVRQEVLQAVLWQAPGTEAAAGCLHKCDGGKELRWPPGKPNSPPSHCLALSP